MSRRRRHGGGGGHDEGGGGLERWLLTYADMITLLLALFIVLFAMSTIDVVRFDALKRTLSQTFKGEILQEPGAVIDGSDGALDPQASSNDAKNAIDMQQEASAAQAAANRVERSLNNQEKRLREAIEQLEKSNAGLKGKLEVTTSERGIIVRLAGDTFFDSGSDHIRPELEKALVPIAKEIMQDSRQVSVEGHTDRAPISTAQFPDNLALSSARANSVVRFLIDQDVPVTSLRAVGYSWWKPAKAPPKDNPEASIAKNRRVEIVILAPGANVGGLDLKEHYGAKPEVHKPQPQRISPMPADDDGNGLNIIGPII